VIGNEKAGGDQAEPDSGPDDVAIHRGIV
jgi:hypothetical protein